MLYTQTRPQQWGHKPQNTMQEATEYIWIYKGKSGFVFAESLYDAKRKVCAEQKIRRSQQGLLSIMPKESYEKGHFMYN